MDDQERENEPKRTKRAERFSGAKFSLLLTDDSAVTRLIHDFIGVICLKTVAQANALYEIIPWARVRVGFNTFCERGSDVQTAQALGSNKNIVQFHLHSWDGLSRECIQALTVAFETSSTLCFVDISGNHLSSRQGIDVIQALTRNSTLESLDLSNNDLGPTFADTVAGMFRENSMPTGILSLNLEKNVFSSINKRAIEEACTASSSACLVKL